MCTIPHPYSTTLIAAERSKLKRELTLLPLFGLIYFTVCGGSMRVVLLGWGIVLIGSSSRQAYPRSSASNLPDSACPSGRVPRRLLGDMILPSTSWIGRGGSRRAVSSETTTSRITDARKAGV